MYSLNIRSQHIAIAPTLKENQRDRARLHYLTDLSPKLAWEHHISPFFLSILGLAKSFIKFMSTSKKRSWAPNFDSVGFQYIHATEYNILDLCDALTSPSYSMPHEIDELIIERRRSPTEKLIMFPSEVPDPFPPPPGENERGRIMRLGLIKDQRLCMRIPDLARYFTKIRKLTFRKIAIPSNWEHSSDCTFNFIKHMPQVWDFEILVVSQCHFPTSGYFTNFLDAMFTCSEGIEELEIVRNQYVHLGIFHHQVMGRTIAKLTVEGEDEFEGPLLDWMRLAWRPLCGIQCRFQGVSNVGRHGVRTLQKFLDFLGSYLEQIEYSPKKGGDTIPLSFLRHNELRRITIGYGKSSQASVDNTIYAIQSISLRLKNLQLSGRLKDLSSRSVSWENVDSALIVRHGAMLINTARKVTIVGLDDGAMGENDFIDVMTERLPRISALKGLRVTIVNI